MHLSKDVVQWLKENAYAVKGEEYYFLDDFPRGQVPNNLVIPVNKRLWGQWLDGATK